MSRDVGVERRAEVVRQTRSELCTLVRSARRFADTAGHPIDDVDDAGVLAGLRRLTAAVAAYRG